MTAPTSILLTLADAVTWELNNPLAGTTWSQTFTAARANVPRNNAAAIGALRVTVRPRDRVSTRASRSIIQDIMRIYVAIQQKVTDDTNTQSDPLVILGEQIQGYFDKLTPLQQLPPMVCEASSFGADADSAWMNTRNENDLLLYTGLIVLTFRGMRHGIQQ